MRQGGGGGGQGQVARRGDGRTDLEEDGEEGGEEDGGKEGVLVERPARNVRRPVARVHVPHRYHVARPHVRRQRPQPPPPRRRLA